MQSVRAGACFGVHFGRWSDNGSQSERWHLLTYAPQQSAAHCSTSGAFEGGYRFATPLIGITPYAAVQVISLDLPAYAERSLVGAGLFALNYGAQTTTDTRTELGLRTDKSFAMEDGVLTLRGRLAWAHDYNPDRAVSAIFQSLPGTSFVVNGARPDPDSALVSASAEQKWLNGFSLAATFEGEFSGNVTSYAGKGVVKYSW
ncbi:hypothetical protein CWO89_17760 [Bradyrhizobium sp. Leo170]|nr:hypothetical protein CWO89_17760 [Bradyrhizobium sp. Leo170]